MEKQIEVEMPEQFKEIFNPKWRHRCWYGGRAGGKTENICNGYLIKAQSEKKLFLMTRETQRSIEDSVYRTLKSLIAKYEYPDFELTKNSIKHKITGSEFIFRGLKTETISSLKSIPDVDYCFVEEAQSVSKMSIDVLLPTIRKEGSQIDWAFNRDTPNDPVWTEIIEKADSRTFVVKINSHDIERFLSATVIEEREKMRVNDPLMYEHVWLGEPMTAKMGSIYAELVAKAREDARINDHVAYDASLPVYTAWDLGISDSTAIVFCQKVGNEVHIIDYYEDSGRSLSDYINVVKQKPYSYELHILPHDTKARELQTGKSREDFFRDMGVHNVKILSANSVENGISLVRSAFNRLWFNEEKCGRLLECLKAYHYEWDDKNQMLHHTPKHDFSSHAADTIRYLLEALGDSSIGKRGGIKIRINSGGVNKIMF